MTGQLEPEFVSDLLAKYLNELLLIEPTMVVVALQSSRTLTDVEAINLKGIRSHTERMDSLVTVLLKKLESFSRLNDLEASTRLFEQFMDALVKSECAPHLLAEMREFSRTRVVTASARSLAETRAAVGVAESTTLDFLTARAGQASDESDSLNATFIDSEHLNYSHYYPVELSAKNTSGAVLIIDNRDYVSSLSHHRSDVDGKLLQSTLTSLGYDVTLMPDLTAKNIIMELGKFVSGMAEDVCSFSLFLLAYGDAQDYVYGVDGIPVNVHALKRLVQGQPVLAGRPKLLFFISARGQRPEKKVPIASRVSSSPHGLHVSASEPVIASHPVPGGQTSHAASDVTGGGDEPDGSTVKQVPPLLTNQRTLLSASDRSSHVPSSADTFVCFATQKKYAIFAVRDKGSWFVNIFCGLLKERSRYLHLLDIMTEVNYYVSSMVLRDDNRTDESSCFGQMPEFVSTLRKQFYFVKPSLPYA